jgi:pyridoxine/pyridoxamine 5'-phosphate oxidase
MDLQRLLDRSLASAGPAIKATFDRDERRLSADELRELWRDTRMFAVSTVSGNGAPHIAPVHVLLTEDDGFEMSIFEHSVRLRDLRRDPRVAITTWAPGGRIVILYGRAREVERSRREVPRDPGRYVLTMEIEPDRAYAMRPALRT